MILLVYVVNLLVTMRLTSPLGAISLIADNSSAIVLPVRLKEEQKAA